MQLPDFIKRAAAFFDKAELNLQAEHDLATAKASLNSINTDLAARDTEITSLKAQIAASAEKITTLEASAAASSSKVVELESAVKLESNRANEVLAGQGIALDQVPAATVAQPGTATESAWSTYQRLISTNPRAAGQFYKEHSADIFTTRPKN